MKAFPFRRSSLVLVAILAVLAAGGCAQSPEAKKAKALERGEQFLKDGKPNEAIIELRAALAVDRDFVPALHALGRAYAAKAWAADAVRELTRAQALAPGSVPIAIDLGRSLLQLGAWPEAEAVAQRILASDPRNANGLAIKSAALVGRRKIAEAQSVLAEIPRETLTPEIESLRAQALLESGDLARAEQGFQAVLASDPKQYRALLGLGRVSLRRRQPGEAVKLFEQARALRPGSPEPRLYLAEARLRLGRLADAIKELEGVEIRARTVPVIFSLARYYLLASRPADAAALLAPLVERFPKLLAARELLGQAYLENRKPDLAAVQYEELARQAPTEPGYQFGLATAHLRQGRGRDALARLDRVAKALDKFPDYHTTRAGALLASGRLDDAAKAAETARRLAPRSAAPYLLLGQIRVQQGNSKAARELFAKAAEVDATSGAPHLALGRLYTADKDLDAALREFDAALRANPKSLPAVQAKAAALVEQRRPGEAIQFVESALKADPRSAGLHTLLGSLHATRGQVGAADVAWRKAVELDPGALAPRLGLARSATSQGKDQEAVAHLQAAVKQHPDSLAAVLPLVEFYEKHSQYDQAISVLEAAAKTSPSEPTLALSLGHMYLKKGRHDDAIARVSAVLADAPELVPARVVRGEAYLAKGDGAAALKDFTEAVRLAPKSGLARYHLARSLVAVGRIPEAQGRYREAIALDPKLGRARAEFAALTGRKPDAPAVDRGIGEIEEAVKKDPANLTKREQLARAYFMRGRLPDAQKELKQVLDRAPGREEANVMMAGILLKLEQPDEAASYLRAALKTNPSHLESNLLLARLLQRKGRPEEALTHVQAALRVNPNLANLYPMFGKLPQAADLARELERREPKSPGPPALAGWIFLAQQSPEAAAEAFRRAIRIKPDLGEAHRGLGDSLQALGQPERAIESYRQAVALNRNDVSALNNLAWLLSEVRKRPDEALPLVTRAAELMPKYTGVVGGPSVAAVLDTLGWVQYRRGAYAEAERALARAVELAPNSGAVHFHLGVTRKVLGKKSEALASLRRAAELNPDLARTEKISDLLKELGG